MAELNPTPVAPGAAYPTADFSDGRAFVIPAGDPRNPMVCAEDHLGTHQACDGPTFVVVGSQVTDQRLVQSLPSLERFGVTLDDLQLARSQAVAMAQAI